LDRGGDALSDLRFGEGIGEQAVGGVIVNVDEAGSEDQPFSVHDEFALFRLQIANFGDVIESDADIAFAQGCAGAVGELRVDDKKRHGLLLREQWKQGGQRHNRDEP